MILMKDITREGNPVLREKCVDVNIPLSSEDEKALNDMLEYIINSQDDELAKKYGLRPGVGLAAPQIGLNKKMLVILSSSLLPHLTTMFTFKSFSYLT